MHILRFISIKLAFFLVLGILLGYFLHIKPLVPILLLLLLISALAITFRKKEKVLMFGILSGIAVVTLGILTVTLSKPGNHHDHYSHLKLNEVQVWHVKIHEVLKPNSFSERYVATVVTVNNSKKVGKIILTSAANFQNKKLKVDEELLIHNTIEEIKEPLNPFQFNYKKYLQHLGIEHQVRLTSQNYVLKEMPSTTVYGIAADLRTRITAQLKRNNFKEQELGIIQALLLGQRNDISEQTYTNYKDAGAVHILAVSGLHIGILLLLLEFLLSPLERLPNGRKVKLFAIVLLLWGFALLAGLSASIIRAVTMFSFVAYALYLNRPTGTFNILALSMFFILLVNPMLLFQVGFQMSYAAVFAIVWIYPILQKLWSPKIWLFKYVWSLLSVSMAAQLGVLPISLFYFHQFPALFFISNLTIIPFLGFILGLGIVVIILALWNSLPHFLVVFYNWLIHSMNTIIAWVAQQELFVFKNIAFGWEQLLWSYVIIIAAILVLTKASYRRIVVLLTGIIGFQIWAIFHNYAIQKAEVFIIAHQTRNSVLLYQKGNELNVITTDSSLTERLVTDYVIGAHSNAISYKSLKNSYLVGNKRLFILDSTGILPKTLKADYLLLSQSPKVNLDRIIDSKQAQHIIADGSNYRTYVEKWKATCEQRNIPFHYTGESGAYYIKVRE